MPSGPLEPTSTGAGVLAILEGATALAAMMLLYFAPRLHSTAVFAAITASLLSLFSGGGFLLGAMLVWVAGALAIYFRTDRTPYGRVSNSIEPGGESLRSEITPPSTLNR